MAESGSICTTHNMKLDKKRKNRQLPTDRLTKNAKDEVKEGKTYECGIGLNLSNESLPQPSPHVNIEGILSSITKVQSEQFEKVVPNCIERPHIIHKKYIPDQLYQLIIFDIETSDTGTKAEICQLSAISQNGLTYNSYIIPSGNISYRASRVNNLTIKCIN